MGDVIMNGFMLIMFYGVLIWSYVYPRESILFGRRWTFNKEPEISETAIRLRKFISLIFIMILTIFLVHWIFGNALVSFLLLIGLTVYVGIGVYKLLPK